MRVVTFLLLLWKVYVGVSAPTAKTSQESSLAFDTIKIQYHNKNVTWQEAFDTCGSDATYPKLIQSAHQDVIMKWDDAEFASYGINKEDLWLGLHSTTNWVVTYRWTAIDGTELTTGERDAYVAVLGVVTNPISQPCMVYKGGTPELVDCATADTYHVICYDSTNAGTPYTKHASQSWTDATTKCTGQSIMIRHNTDLAPVIAWHTTAHSGVTPWWTPGVWLERVFRDASNPTFTWSTGEAPITTTMNELIAQANGHLNPGLCVVGVSRRLESCGSLHPFICAHEIMLNRTTTTTIDMYTTPAIQSTATGQCTDPAKFPVYDAEFVKTDAFKQMAAEVDVNDMWSNLKSPVAWATESYKWSEPTRPAITSGSATVTTFEAALATYSGSDYPCRLGIENAVLTDCSATHLVMCDNTTGDSIETIFSNLDWSAAPGQCDTISDTTGDSMEMVFSNLVWAAVPGQCDTISDTTGDSIETIFSNLAWVAAPGQCDTISGTLYLGDGALPQKAILTYFLTKPPYSISNTVGDVWADKIVRASVKNTGFTRPAVGPAPAVTANPEELRQLEEAALKQNVKTIGKCVVGWDTIAPEDCAATKKHWCVKKEDVDTALPADGLPNITKVDYTPKVLDIVWTYVKIKPQSFAANWSTALAMPGLAVSASGFSNYQYICSIVLYTDIVWTYVKIKPQSSAANWSTALAMCSAIPGWPYLPLGEHQAALATLVKWNVDAKAAMDTEGIDVEEVWSGLRGEGAWTHEYKWHSPNPTEMLSTQQSQSYRDAMSHESDLLLCQKGLDGFTLVNCSTRLTAVCKDPLSVQIFRKLDVTWQEGLEYCKSQNAVMLHVDVSGVTLPVGTLRGDVWSDKVVRVSSATFKWHGLQNLAASTSEMEQIQLSASQMGVADPPKCVVGINTLRLVDCDKERKFFCVQDKRVTVNSVDLTSRKQTWVRANQECLAQTDYMLPQYTHQIRITNQLQRNGQTVEGILGPGASLNNMWLGLRTQAAWTLTYNWKNDLGTVSSTTENWYKQQLTDGADLAKCVMGIPPAHKLVDCSIVGQVLCIDDGDNFVTVTSVTWQQAADECKNRSSGLPTLDSLGDVNGALILNIQSTYSGDPLIDPTQFWVDSIVRTARNEQFNWTSLDVGATDEYITKLHEIANGMVTPEQCVAGIDKHQMSLRSCDEKLPFACVKHENYKYDAPTYTTTMAPFVPPKSGIVCTCVGGCPPDPTSWSPEVKEKVVNEILEKLEVNKSGISATVNKYVSATDDRPSATAVGGVGVVLFVTVFGGLIALDLPSLISFVQSIGNTVTQIWQWFVRPTDVIYA